MTRTEIQQYVADNCLYIVKYGRGAVIVALENNKLEDIASDVHKRDDLKNFLEHSNLSKVDEINASKNYLTVKYLVQEDVRVTRVIPKSQVTFETYSYTSTDD